MQTGDLLLGLHIAMSVLSCLAYRNSYYHQQGLDCQVATALRATCEHHTVPLDHSKQGGPVTATAERQRQIWLINGGPGESGTELAPLMERTGGIFDLVIPDHRGTVRLSSFPFGT